MQSISTKKRKSDQLDMSSDNQHLVNMAGQKGAVNNGSAHPQEGPLKRQKVGITHAQKQALIDNLQLEIAERARKLRANYNIHAQSLRTRVEIRVNRIPLALRKLTMGELLEKYSEKSQQRSNAQPNSARSPSSKDVPSRPPTRGAVTSTHPVKRRSHEMTGGDKENEGQLPQKKIRQQTTDNARNPAQALSPAPSNSKVPPRTGTTPARPGTARPPVTPGRAVAATNALNKMVDGTRSTNRPATATGMRKAFASSAGPGSSALTTATATTSTASAEARKKRGTTVPAPPGSSSSSSNAHHHHHHHHSNPPSSASRPATRTARRASGASESSEASTSTVIRKRPMTAPPGTLPKPQLPSSASQQQQQQTGTTASTATNRRTVPGPAKKTVPASGPAKKPAPAGKGAAPANGTGTGTGSGSGRVLRKRA
ncbi:hypothetical protein VTH82DRAFT_2610 [Thermothelomyces myriococcoides]